MAGRLVGKFAAISPTVRRPLRNNLRISLRVGSAIARNTALFCLRRIVTIGYKDCNRSVTNSQVLWLVAKSEALKELLGFLYAECCMRNRQHLSDPAKEHVRLSSNLCNL